MDAPQCCWPRSYSYTPSFSTSPECVPFDSGHKEERSEIQISAAMVPVGGLLVAAIVKMVGAKLGSVIGEQASLMWNVRKDMEEMKETLETIGAALEDAEERSVKEKEVRLWLKRLKDAAYHISDMLDDFQVESTMAGILPTSVRKIRQANKMKGMRKKLRKIQEQHTSLKFTHSTISIIDQQPYDQRETTSDVNDSDILGRDAEKRTLINLLSECHNKDGTVILPIYGLGGIGKTTLAGLLYNDTQLKKYDCRVWVYVSQEFDLKKIGRSIVSQLAMEGGQQSTDTLQLINRGLDCLIRGKTVLIVLDDLWEERESELEKLKSMLHVGKKGSMIDVIVTTRKKNIAKKICTNEPYMLHALKDEMCWDIIKRSSGFEHKTNKEQLALIGLEIAKKCGGVALAAKALGYLLRSKNLQGWSEINDSDIWNKSSEDDNSLHATVLPSLKLSYQRMTPHMRLCFSYCAMFLKGCDIFEDDLIHQWVALDFINLSKGKEYVKQLLGMSFIQHSKKPIVLYQTSKKDVALYKMHDLVHDLARSVIGDELIEFGGATKSSTSGQKYCRYALVTNYDRTIKLSNVLPKKVRALRFLDSSKLDLSGGAFSFAKCLRILDFSECSSILLPASIGQLRQLRCLIAPRTQNERLPECITELSKLQYLNLKGSSQISALPESVGKLGCLMYLDLSDCSCLSKLPESFGDLKSLVHLDTSCCSEITELPGSFGNMTSLQHLELSGCKKVKALPESVCGLRKLQHLNLSRCCDLRKLPEAIGSLVDLRYLSMSFCRNIKELPESFQNLRNLEHLNFSFNYYMEGLPGALRGLNSLQHLDISNRRIDTAQIFRHGGLYHGELYDALGSLTKLKYLNLSSINQTFIKSGGKRVINVDFIGGLTNLECLDLSWNSIVYLPESVGNLKRLHTLNLSHCKNLKSLPDSIGAITLKSLLMEGCSDELIDQANSLLHYSLTLPLFKVRADESGTCSNLQELKGVDTEILNIRSLENIRSLDEAQGVKLLDKQNLSVLTLTWTLGAGRLLEDEDFLEQLVPPRGLKRLKIKGYSSISFPSWVIGISYYLPSLVTISLVDLPACSDLPPLGQLPNLEILYLSALPSITTIDRHFCGGKRAFRQLSSLSMNRMEGLEEWNTTYPNEHGVEEFMFPRLDMLIIEDCPRLRLKPCPPIFRECKIEKSDLVISSLEELDNINHVSSSTQSTKLVVNKSSCQSLRLLHHFPALQELEIFDCPNLTSLLESMRHLTSLRSLELSWCKSISALPGCLGELSSLRRLIIKSCNGIKSLPPCIQQLTNLQKLHIEYNRALKQWCESKENENMLKHISDIKFIRTVISLSNHNKTLPTRENARSLLTLSVWSMNCQSLNLFHHFPALQELEIASCPNLTSLQECMRHAGTSLQSLELRWCDSI
ncbi:hypothetical protein ACP70R_050148 [Stipagrostis hirtigluma subsp. patula]